MGFELLAPALSIGGSLVSGFMGGGDQESSQSQQRDPWGPQGDALRRLFAGAEGVYDQQKGTPFYQGSLYAPWTANQQAGAGALATAGKNATGYSPGILSAGYGALSGLPGMMATGQNLSGGVPIQTGAGNALAGNTQTALDFGNAGFGGALAALRGNTAGNLVANAGQFVNNDLVNGQIDAAGRDIARNLGEDILPGLNLQASLSGNVNSSRAGAAEAIARRGAEDRLGDISSGIRSNAYATGLQMANQQTQQNISGGLGLGNGGIATANAGVGGQQANNSALFGNAGVMGQGAGILGQGSSLGAGLLSLGNQFGAQGAGMLSASGEAEQANQQKMLDELFAKWQGGQNQPWAPLNNWSNILQKQNWGGTSTGTSTAPGDDPFSTALGTFGMLAGSTNKGGKAFDSGSLSGAIAGLFNK